MGRLSNVGSKMAGKQQNFLTLLLSKGRTPQASEPWVLERETRVKDTFCSPMHEEVGPFDEIKIRPTVQKL